MASPQNRQELQPAFVLHRYAFRETSFILEVFTRQFGRVPLVAKGARRPRSPLRGLLAPFQPLLLSWVGTRELRTLAGAEWQGGQPQLSGSALMSGFYANELLLYLLARDDPHADLFDDYAALLRELAELGAPADTDRLAARLRRFEIVLLRRLGYALNLDVDADTGEPVEADQDYRFLPERGPVPAYASAHGVEISGRSLLALARDELESPAVLAEAKTLMRAVLGHHMNGRTLFSRQFFFDFQSL